MQTQILSGFDFKIPREASLGLGESNGTVVVIANGSCGHYDIPLTVTLHMDTLDEANRCIASFAQALTIIIPNADVRVLTHDDLIEIANDLLGGRCG